MGDPCKSEYNSMIRGQQMAYMSPGANGLGNWEQLTAPKFPQWLTQIACDGVYVYVSAEENDNLVLLLEEDNETEAV